MAVELLCICKDKVGSVCSMFLLFPSLLSRFLIFVLWRFMCLTFAQSNTPTPFTVTLCSSKLSPLLAQEMEW